MKHLPGISAKVRSHDGHAHIVLRRGELASMKITLDEALTLADLLVDLVEQTEESSR